MMESLNKYGLGFEVIPSYDVHILRPDSHKRLHSAAAGENRLFASLLALWYS